MKNWCNYKFLFSLIFLGDVVRFSGCYTASITPMRKDGDIDHEGLKQLVEFQVSGGVNGILASGTTGEGSTLTPDEHTLLIERIHEYLGKEGLTIGGTGSNCTRETMKATRHACNIGIHAVLLVDPYYNGPSSLEIRREYIEPVAAAFPGVQIILYVIPGRTGCQLLPQDIAILHSQYENVRAVKEATGNLENMKLTRKLCGSDFDILSGDDNMTFGMMTSPDIGASGVVSVASNVAPKAVQDMTQYILNGDVEGAKKLKEALDPLFEIVTVKTEEDTPYGPRLVRARNPLPYKTLMNVLGMPSGPCRQPLGKMTRMGLEEVLKRARSVHEKSPEILEPVEEFFDVNLSKRLYDESCWDGLHYG